MAVVTQKQKLEILLENEYSICYCMIIATKTTIQHQLLDLYKHIDIHRYNEA